MFRDDAARLWNAWDVHPLWGERRTGDRRHDATGLPSPSAIRERRHADRRRESGLRISLPARLAKGWIAFECGDLRRRVAPIPAGWHELPDSGLFERWRDAEELPPRRKRLVE